MSKPLDPSYLDGESEIDSGVSFYRCADDLDSMLLVIATQPSGSVHLRLSLRDAKRLANRLFTVARGLGGELTAERERPN